MFLVNCSWHQLLTTSFYLCSKIVCLIKAHRWLGSSPQFARPAGSQGPGLGMRTSQKQVRPCLAQPSAPSSHHRIRASSFRSALPSPHPGPGSQAGHWDPPVASPAQPQHLSQAAGLSLGEEVGGQSLGHLGQPRELRSATGHAQGPLVSWGRDTQSKEYLSNQEGG